MGIEPDKYECSTTNYVNVWSMHKKKIKKSYNERMNNFIKKSTHFTSPNLLLIDKGRRDDEKKYYSNYRF